MTIRPAAARLLALALLLLASGAPRAAQADDIGSNGACSIFCTGTNGDGFTGTRGHRDPGSPGGPGTPATTGTGTGVGGIRTETVYTPTCPGNSGTSFSGLCTAALSGCPTPGDVRYWRYMRSVDVATGATSPWQKVTPPPFLCLGADAPGVDPRLAVIALVRSEFKDFPLEKAVVTTRPAGQSLVNASTVVSTEADGRDALQKTILGLPVHLTAVATTYTWYFGDGAVSTTSAHDTPPGDVRHIYTQPGPVSVSLDIDYRGTFTVGDSPEVYEADGTAHIVGPATPLLLREARSQLEAGPS